jgi:hypothetical protein
VKFFLLFLVFNIDSSPGCTGWILSARVAGAGLQGRPGVRGRTGAIVVGLVLDDLIK